MHAEMIEDTAFTPPRHINQTIGFVAIDGSGAKLNFVDVNEFVDWSRGRKNVILESR